MITRDQKKEILRRCKDSFIYFCENFCKIKHPSASSIPFKLFKYQVDSIGGIIMNPTDGSIYALSSKPDFDLNNFSKVKTVSTFSNPIVENVFEFGSIIKPLVMAGAIDAGVVTADTKYEDKGSVVVEDKEIFNFSK